MSTCVVMSNLVISSLAYEGPETVLSLLLAEQSTALIFDARSVIELLVSRIIEYAQLACSS